MRRAFNGNFPITRAFGVYDPVAYANYPGKRHPGTDYGLPQNIPLVAGMSGSVIVYDRDPNLHTGRGKEVVITFANKQRKTCHMNRIDVQTGQYVKEGQVIGLSGYTGYVMDSNGKIGTPEGAHLHDELLIDGAYVPVEAHLKEERPKMTAAQLDTFIATIYNKVAGRNPSDGEFAVHRKEYEAQGDVWLLRMAEGFTGDEVAWKKYERNLKEATAKIAALEADGTALTPGKYIVK